MQLGAENWQERYEQGKTGWDRGAPSPMLLSWLEQRDLNACRILIPGCGSGHEVLELASRGFEVTGIDFASSPVQRLRKSLAERGHVADIVQSDALSYEPEAPFDVVYDQTFLCAIAPELRIPYEAQVRKWLKPDGRLFILFMQSNRLKKQGPPFHCDVEDMQRLFSSSSWIWPDEPPRHVDHSANIFELATVLRKR